MLPGKNCFINLIFSHFNPLLLSAPYIRRSGKILILMLRKDDQKNSDERRDYESVDEKSLS